MFMILVNNVFLNFWTNSPQDIFLVNTMDKLRLNPSEVKMIYYEKLPLPVHFNINLDNSIDILEKVETVVNDETVISWNILETIPGILYYENGNMLLPC